ncbi:RNase H domain-containing protein [Trichonephila clavipes]|nr:RNase H domain-containing protein [Trichonephila clavipes]
MESLVTPLRSIQTAADRVIEQVVAFTLRNVERFFCHRNPDFSSVFKSELIPEEHGHQAILNEQDFRDFWVLSDSRSSLQHFYNCIKVGDKAGVSILQKLTQISESPDVHFQWILSHVNIFGNEQADLLAKDGCNASPPISSTLTYSEHQSRVKSEILKEWRTPPNHHWYESKIPGSSFLLKCGRASETAMSRLKSGHIKSFLLWRQEDFALCTNCKPLQITWTAWDFRGRTFFPLSSWYWTS